MLRVKLPKPVFTERQVGTSWAYSVLLGDVLISSPTGRAKKKVKSKN